MLNNKQLVLPDFITYKEGLYVNRLRKFLNDTEELNILEQEKESSDSFLNMCLQDTIEEINYEFNPITTKTIEEIPWNLLKIGATIQVLLGKGILSARNTLTYSDSGGIQVSNYDKYGRYVNYYNILINKYKRSVATWKMNENVSAAYGGVHSEYDENYGDAD